jgi:hypothetical protein
MTQNQKGILGDDSTRRKTKYDTRSADEIKQRVMSAKPKKKKIILKFKDGLPQIKLKELEDIGVCIEGQKDFDTVMQLYECAGWKKYNSGRNPTDIEKPDYGKICIDAYIRESDSESEEGFKTIEKRNYQGTSISLEKFLEEQKISNEKVKKINDWFSENKPKRDSQYTYELPF